MKRNILIFVFCIVMNPTFVFGENSFDLGVEAYKNLKFDKALKYFQDELNKSQISGELAFNIGNCFYKQNEFGRAVLWYKKAEKLMFSDPDLNFNLNQAYEKLSINKDDASLFLDKVFFLKTFLPESFINYLFLFIETVFVLLSMIFSGRKFIKIKFFLGLTGLILFLNSLYNYSLLTFYKQGIIINNSKIHSAYSNKSSILFTIPGGSKVLIKEHKNGFYKIITNKGDPGWVLEENIGTL